MKVDFITFLRTLFLKIVIRALGSLSSLLMTYFVATNNKLEVTGEFFFFLSSAAILSVISRFGSETMILKNFAAYNASHNCFITLLKSCLLVSSFNSILVLVIFFIFCDGFILSTTDFSAELILYFGVYLFLLSLNTLIGMAFQGMARNNIATIALSLGANILFIPLVIILGAQNLKELIVCMTLSASLVFFFVTYLLIFQTRKAAKGKELHIRLSELFKNSLPFWIINICSQLTIWSGQLFLGMFTSAENVGLYNASHKLSLITSFLLLAINMLIAPRFALYAKNNNYENLKSLFIMSSQLIVVVTLPVVITMLLFSSSLLRFIGDEYVNGDLALKILAVGQLVNVCCGSVGYFLTMTGYEKEAKNASLLSTFFLLSLSIVLIPFYDVVGAAIATSVAVIIVNLLNARTAFIFCKIDILDIYSYKKLNYLFKRR